MNVKNVIIANKRDFLFLNSSYENPNYYVFLDLTN